MLLGNRVLLFKFERWLIVLSVDELNFTIMVEFIFDLVAFIAAAFMLFNAVRPADVFCVLYPLI
jgi:hypothetical protein